MTARSARRHSPPTHPQAAHPRSRSIRSPPGPETRAVPDDVDKVVSEPAPTHTHTQGGFPDDNDDDRSRQHRRSSTG
ncbi:MAG TPA: hypothetical protein VES01_05085, partial [Dermatophilaceae bacterium]|nr:hypothetical protein [Dermatophilaceae bacterium]